MYPTLYSLTFIFQDIMFTCKIKAETKPEVFWSFQNQTIHPQNDRLDKQEY